MFRMAIDQSKYSNLQLWVMNALGVLTILPLAPYINRFMPSIQVWDWHIDLLLSILLALLFTRLLLWFFKPLIIPVFLLVTTVMLINQLTGRYSYANVLNDYQGAVKGNWGTQGKKQMDILSFYPRRVETYVDRTVRGIREKVNYKDSTVRNFSVQHSLDYYDEYWPKYGKLVRYLSLYRYIREHFKYVNDSQRDEYFATPMETILNGMGGDCDDHSLLMTSCLQSIGAKTRIVLIRGHAYPELYCGNEEDFELIKQAVVLLFNNPPVKELYYHEMKGEYWINLDYTARHPGGPYLNDKVYALIEL